MTIKSRLSIITKIVISVTRGTAIPAGTRGEMALDMKSDQRKTARAVIRSSSKVSSTRTGMQNGAMRDRMRNQEDRKWVR